MSAVLVLKASPRAHGNSATLADSLTRGAREAGHAVQAINVARKSIAPCLGCNACYRNEGVCVQHDNMKEVRQAMFDADVIALASPIYFNPIAAQLKLTIDRTYAFFQQLAGKRFCYLIACAAPDASYAQTMIASLDGFTCCVPDAHVVGTVIGTNANDVEDTKGTPAEQEAYQLGLSL